MNAQTGIRLSLVALAATLIWAAFQGRDVRDRYQLSELEFAPQDNEAVTLLIDVADNLSASEREAFFDELGIDPRLNSAFSEDEGLYRFDASAAAAASLYEMLQGDENVEFIELEATYETFGAANTQPNDPLYPFQWHFDQVNASGAWARADGQGTVVAVIDTGVAFRDDETRSLRQVRDLSGTLFVPGYDFVDDNEAPLDEHGHGTHVAGTIAQTTDNGYGVAGLAPAARIMPIRVLDGSGRGQTADIAEAIRFAADNGADIINMSLGGPMPSRIMQDAVSYARSKGVVVIAAAGNGGTSRPSYPAAYPDVFAVAATQFDRTTTFYSNYGRYVDIAAPGGNVRVDQNNDGRPDGVMQETLQRENTAEHEFALYMGTSMAAPHVAGIAALIHSTGVTHPERIESLLAATSSQEVPRYDVDRYGAGLVDAEAATRGLVRRFQLPRSAVALAVLLLMLFLTRQNLANASPLQRFARISSATIAALFTVAGLALPLAFFAGLGADVSALAPLQQSPVLWGSLAFGPGGVNALVASVLPVALLWLLFSHTRSHLLQGILLGISSGASAWLIGSGFAPLTDITLLPGMGTLDRVWLFANGLLALVFTMFGSLPRARGTEGA